MLHDNTDRSPIDSSYQSSDNTSSHKIESQNPDEKGTSCNTSPRLTEAQINENYFDSTYDKAIEAGKLPDDIKTWSPEAKAAYVLGHRDERLRLIRNDDPYQRSDRYDERFGTDRVTSRIDTSTFTIPLGRDGINLKRFKTLMRKLFRVLFQTSDKNTKYYNYLLEDYRYGCRIEYSLESDVAGSSNNKGKATITLQGKFMAAQSLNMVMQLFLFLKKLKAKCKRIDARMSDHTNYVIPRQIFAWMRSQKETFGKLPIVGCRKMDFHGNGDGDDTLSLGSRKSDFFLRIYDERHNHNIDSTCWELEIKNERADAFFKNVVATYEIFRLSIESSAKEYVRDKRPLINQEIYNKQVECNAYHESFDDLREELITEHFNDGLELATAKEFHGIIAGAITSAFTFTEGRTAKDTHIDRLKEASWYTEFKAKIKDLQYFRPPAKKQTSSIEKGMNFLQNSCKNTIIKVAASIANIDSKQLKEISASNPTAAAEVLLGNLTHWMMGILPEYLSEDKFFRSIHAKQLNAA